jgi:hypothetical protein
MNIHLFWEGHKNLKKYSISFWIFMSQSSMSNFVAFSQYMNFNLNDFIDAYLEPRFFIHSIPNFWEVCLF